MTHKEYNGHYNYETWVVSLWMDQDGGSFWSEIAQECYDQANADEISTKEQRAAYDLSDRIKADHFEHLPEVEGFAADLLSAAMSEVNWREIARSLIAEVERE